MASTLKINNLDTASGTTITVPTGKTIIGTDTGSIKAPGTPIQVVYAIIQTHPQYGSTSYVATDVQVAITPKFSDSKFLIEGVYSTGTNAGTNNSHDCCAAINIRDSINPSGANAAIVTDNASGAGSSRTGGFMLMPSTAQVAQVTTYWVHQIPLVFLYTPSYQNTNARTFGFLIKNGSASQGSTQNMTDSNIDDRRDIRGSSTIKVTEIAQ